MRKFQQTGISRNQENEHVKRKCECNGNPEYARKSERPPLANVQGAASINAVKSNLKREIDHRSKFTTKSCSSPISFNIKSSSGTKPRKLACAAIDGRSKSATRFSEDSCRFKLPSEPKQQIHNSTTKKYVPLRYPLKTQVAAVSCENTASNHCSQFSRITPSSTLCHQPCTESTKQCVKQIKTEKVAAVSCGSTASYRCSQVSRITPSSTLCQQRCAESTKQYIKLKTEKVSFQVVPASPSIKVSQMTSSASTHRSFTDPKKILPASIAQRPDEPLLTSNINFKNLKDHHFVTLTQDTLRTTQCTMDTELDSMMSTMSKVRFSRDTSQYVEETSFVSGELFEDIDQGRCSTTIKVSLRSPFHISFPRRRSNSIPNTLDDSKKPAVKSTIKRRSLTKDRIPFPLLYSPEYKEDIIAYCFTQKNNISLKSAWIEKFVTLRSRTNCVHWLLQFSEYISPKYENIYYMAVQLFDYVLVKLRLRENYYQVAVIVAFWISMKFLDNTIILKVPKLFSVCNGKYSTKEILSMERRILKSIRFCLNISDPLDFLYNFLKLSSLDNDEKIEHGAKFVMECATLFEPMMEAPFLAASALYAAYKILRNVEEVPINFIWYNREKEKLKFYAEQILEKYVQNVCVQKYEPYLKYNTSEKLYVALIFEEITTSI